MNLEIDMGNTRFKWRLKDNKKTIVAGSVANKDICEAENFNEVFVAIGQNQPLKIGVARVSNKHTDSFDAWCQKKWNLVPHYLQVSASDLGVSNAYIDIEQMGVDRWLAMLAAYSEVDKQACLIVDCGSACTVDIVLADGAHLGGYIVPGLQLMKNALFRDTDRVKLDEVSYDSDLSPGKTTQQAVSAGLWMMQLGLINVALERLLEEGAANLCIFFTGGNGEHLLSLFSQQLSTGSNNELVSRLAFRSNLVFDGISLLLESR